MTPGVTDQNEVVFDEVTLELTGERLDGTLVATLNTGTAALAGQSVNEAVIVDFSQHCRAILSVDVSRRRAVVEPGVTLDQLNEALSPHGLMFGPDVATSSHATPFRSR